MKMITIPTRLCILDSISQSQPARRLAASQLSQCSIAALGFLRRSKSLLACILSCTAVFSTRADINWDGDNSVGNFSYCNNWYGNSCPGWGFSSGNLVFNYRNNGDQISLYYDLSWNNINDIIWETTFGAGLPLTGNGNGINFNQRVENRSSYAQSVSIPLSGAKNGASQIELNAVNGNLSITGPVYNDSNKPFYAYGSNSKMLTVGSALTGDSSVSFTIASGAGTGYGMVKFTAAQTWGDSTHGAYVNRGELWIDSGGSLKSGIPVTLGLADANTAKLWLSVLSGGTTFPQNITVANSGGTKVIGGLNTSGTHTYTGNITLNGPANLVADQSGGMVEFSAGVISGGSSVGINTGATSAGKVTLSGANTYSGDTTLSAGQLNINYGGSSSANSAIGTGRLTIAGGTIDNTSSGDVTLLPNNTQSWDGDFTYAGSVHNLNLGTGAVTPNANRQVTVTANTLTVGGAVGGGAISLTKAGSGTLTLSGANTYTGNTTISGGTLLVNGSLAAGSAVNVSAGGILGGAGTAAGTITVNGTLAPGASIGTLTTGAETWKGGGSYVCEMTRATNAIAGTPGMPGTDWDLINLTGNLTIASTNTSTFTIVITNSNGSSVPTDFDATKTYSWKIAEVTDSGSSVVGFNAAKFTVSSSNFSPAPAGTFGVVLVDKSICVVYAPTACRTTSASYFVDGTDSANKLMVMMFTNSSGLLSVQPMRMDNCTTTGREYANIDLGTNGGTSIGSLSLASKYVLSSGTMKVVLWAEKLPGHKGETAFVNAIAINTCGLGKSFDPVLTTLQITSSNQAQQRFEGLLAAEQYLHVINGAPGLEWLEVNLNGRIFRLDPLADNQEVAADLASAMREGDNNVVILTGGGDLGASAIVTITDTPSGKMVSLPEVVRLAMRQTANGLELSWADTLVCWTLQASAVPDGGWAVVRAEPVAVEGQLALTVPVVEGARFYRLASPTSETGSPVKAASQSDSGISILDDKPTQQSTNLTYGGIIW